MQSHLFRILLWLGVLLSTSCSHYDISLNDRLVWTPPTIYSDFQVADPALQNCLAATIESGQIMRASDLTRLNCRHAGIRSLEGLATFSRLTDLMLAGNALQDANAVFQLVHLRHLEIELAPLSDPGCALSERIMALPLEQLVLNSDCI